MITTGIEAPRQGELLELLRLGDEYAFSLYPADSCYLLDVSELEDEGVFVFVARDTDGGDTDGSDSDGRALGMAALVVAALGSAGETARTAELKRLFVLESARGQGVARSLLAAVEAQARASGVSTILLETGPLQHAAIELYESLGYEHIPRFGQYIGDPHSVCMAKPMA